MTSCQNYYKSFIRYCILGAAAASVLIGLTQQEQLVVFTKAVNICLECIGVG